MRRAKISTPGKAWLAVFAVWLLLLSGALSGLVGSPGMIQAIRLQGLLDQKQDQVLKLEGEIEKLEEEQDRLQKNRVAQEREIRRVLGYASSDEIIFDFAAAERSPAGID